MSALIHRLIGGHSQHNSQSIQEEEKKIHDKPPAGLCSRITNGTVEVFKRLGIGVASGVGIMFGTGSLGYLAERVGILTSIKDKTLASLISMGGDPEALKKVARSECMITTQLEELIKLNPNPETVTPEIKQQAFDELKAIQINNGLEGTFRAPIIEELLYRGLIQDVLLTRIPKFVIKKFAPGKEALLDTNYAKAARIVLSAAIFAADHLSQANLQNSSSATIGQDVILNASTAHQVSLGFLTGIGLGIIKESRAGILGSIAAHMTNNSPTLIQALRAC